MECTEDLVHHRVKSLLLALFSALWLMPAAHAQDTQPLVAIHDSELTRALETIPATAPTPNGAGTTGFEWWARDWHYFLMPESVMEALRSDGTAFTTVGDANIAAGLLLTNGAPKYPIVISLASEAIRDDEIAQLTNYVAAGGNLRPAFGSQFPVYRVLYAFIREGILGLNFGPGVGLVALKACLVVVISSHGRPPRDRGEQQCD